MPTIRIPTPLRSYTDGMSEVKIHGASVGDALADLVNQYPNLKPHLYGKEGELRPYVNVFLGEDNVNDLSGAQTPIQGGDRLVIIPSIAGGTASLVETGDRCLVL